LSSPEPSHLSNNHRDTLLKIFQDPTSHNIQWREVASLVSAVGSVEETPGGRYRLVIGDDGELVDRPRNKDVDEQMVVDLRRMLTAAGYDAVVAGLPKGQED
jgi:hypothetical protein